ncbi:hypothetical protein [Bacillus sp. S1-R2T1-FB]|uniref:hypothetical protein n=1 Tax=Bacillus sp. S1-R2T1-FB TaxID=1973493 RepID=UPI00115508AF|nr:hypothetical protein [Bacillus sp. S1-R2T1-FB]
MIRQAIGQNRKPDKSPINNITDLIKSEGKYCGRKERGKRRKRKKKKKERKEKRKKRKKGGGGKRRGNPRRLLK